jgi:hypothetical protein
VRAGAGSPGLRAAGSPALRIASFQEFVFTLYVPNFKNNVRAYFFQTRCVSVLSRVFHFSGMFSYIFGDD